MGPWIEQHATLLQVGVSIATLMIWIFYAQLLFQSYRRVRRPKIVINQMLGKSDKARFLISNMSQEAIHIDKVLVCLGDETHQVCEQATDTDPDLDFQNDEVGKSARAARLDELTVQGPLESGKCIELGALQNLVRRITHQARASDETEPPLGQGSCRIEIIVIAVYSSEKGVIGALSAMRADNCVQRPFRPPSMPDFSREDAWPDCMRNMPDPVWPITKRKTGPA